ncbi:MAG: zinc-binding dehydrogenase, partial [Anaerolineae bacterium]
GTTLKAVVMHRRGGPEVLQYQDWPTPEPGPGEIVIRVKAAALNHLDVFARKGAQAVKVSLPHILGSEAAGEVVALGDGVTRWRSGDRVAVGPGIWCRECDFCQAGEENMCRRRIIVGIQAKGGYAEYIKVPAYNPAPIPDGVSDERAAATFIAFGTAWHMLCRAEASEGETVLVLAAGSGVGVAGIQVARHLGCRVIAAASSDEKLDRAKELGAEAVINYRQTPRFGRAVKKLTGGRGVDIVFEHIGADTWKESVEALAIGGRVVTCGASSGRWGQTDLWSLFAKQARLIGSFSSNQNDFYTVLDLVGRGRLTPIIDTVLPLAEAAEGHRRLEARDVFGKIILKP